MAVFSPAFRNSKLSELLEQCVRIPNSSASIRFLAVLIEDAGETLMREDLLWGAARGTQNYPRRLCWGVVFKNRGTDLFIPTEVTLKFFFQTTTWECIGPTSYLSREHKRRLRARGEIAH